MIGGSCSGPARPRTADVSGDRSSLKRPRSTYRVQLHRAFGFSDAARITGYLSEMGVSNLYCSPYLQAVSGSTHGYDIVDFHRPASTRLAGRSGQIAAPNTSSTKPLWAHGPSTPSERVPS
jgi:hypothetical protein